MGLLAQKTLAKLASTKRGTLLMLAFDNTTLADFKRCMRYGYFRHIRGWVHPGPQPALLFGLSWHDAMDALWGGEDVDAAVGRFNARWIEGGGPWPAPYPSSGDWFLRSPANAKLMLKEYAKKRKKLIEALNVVAIEERFAVGLLPDVWYVGRHDKVVEDSTGNLIIVEHKTTSQAQRRSQAQMGWNPQFGTSWLNQWVPNSQIDGYAFAASQRYERPVVVWIDGTLIAKPYHMDSFIIIPVQRPIEHIGAWFEGAQDWAKRILYHWHRIGSPPSGFSHGTERTHDTNGASYMAEFPQNTDSCTLYNRTCPYLDICKNHANPENLKKPPYGLVENLWRPVEPETIERASNVKLHYPRERTNP